MARFGFGSGIRTRFIVGGMTAAICLPLQGGAAQNTPSPAQSPQNSSQPVATLSVMTREVLVDVVVTDGSGHPVTGLTATNFAVSEEGDLQHLTHLEEHLPMDAAKTATLMAAPASPPNTFTNFLPVKNTNASTVILLDALDTPVQSQMELRQQLIEYLKHMEPGTPIAIFQIDTQMRLIQGFSGDPQVLLAAAKSKRDMISLQEPNRGSREEFRRARLDILRDGFRTMGRYLAGFPGRKNLIWFTAQVPEGYRTHPLESSFGKSFRDDFSVLDDDPRELTDALTLSRVAVYPIDARGLETPAQYDVSMRGPPSMGANRRFETSRAFQHMDLDNIAEQTGGKAYYNTNGLKDVIAEIVNNGSHYYTLAYATTNQKWEGEFRHIKVKLDRPGLRIQYRQGYFATDRTKLEQRLLAAMQRRKIAAPGNPFGDAEPESGDPQPATEEAAAPAAATPAGTGALVQHPKGGFEASMQLGAIPPTEVILTASLSIDDKVEKLDKKAPLPEGNFLVADYKTKPFRTYLLQLKADARALRLAKAADGTRHGTVEFVTLVYDQSGHQANSLMSTAELSLSESKYLQLLEHGLPMQQEIAIPVKGSYFLRVGVHDVASDHIGAIEIPVDLVRAGLPGSALVSH